MVVYIGSLEAKLACYILYMNIHYLAQSALEKISQWQSKRIVSPQYTESEDHRVTVIHGSTVFFFK